MKGYAMQNGKPVTDGQRWNLAARIVSNLPAILEGADGGVIQEFIDKPGESLVPALHQVLAEEKDMTYGVLVGVGETTDNIVKVLKASGLRVDEDINQKNFPLYGSNGTYSAAHIGIVDPGRPFYGDECPALLRAVGLEQPSYEHALRFARTYTTTAIEKNQDIVFPHKPWLDSGNTRRVLYLSRNSQYPSLSLFYFDHGFRDNVIIAGVRRPFRGGLQNY